jgi:hypothetical protein
VAVAAADLSRGDFFLSRKQTRLGQMGRVGIGLG